MNIIYLHDIEVILLRKSIRNINLRIYQDGSIKVSAPLKCSISEIEFFLNDRYIWIITKRNALLKKSKPSSNMLENGDLQPFLGKKYPLVINNTNKKQHIFLSESAIECYLNIGASYELRQSLLQNWYRQQIKKILPELIKKWEPIINVEVNEWGVKLMKTRWGSCNTVKKRIWLNLNLIHKPINCLEYVLVHEMVHLLEASHNKRFYAFMSEFLPNWRESREILNCS
ncbi:MAG: SprT family zinc-dependent metalloprotease [Legionellaceae bacterium]|nr:SprT family zinc-dependent metalloprotease [Legionellaceae bacterium]